MNERSDMLVIIGQEVEENEEKTILMLTKAGGEMYIDSRD